MCCVYCQYFDAKLLLESCLDPLFLPAELLGDENSLLEAVHRLGQADQYLAKMAKFWANMAVLLMHLMKESTLGNYLQQPV